MGQTVQRCGWPGTSPVHAVDVALLCVASSPSVGQQKPNPTLVPSSSHGLVWPHHARKYGGLPFQSGFLQIRALLTAYPEPNDSETTGLDHFLPFVFL